MMYKIPPYGKTLTPPPRKHYGLPKYITYQRGAYVVQKRVNGELKYFGRFELLNDAIKEVKKLRRNNWKQ